MKFAAVLVAAVAAFSSSAWATATPGQPAPAFRGVDVGGKAASLADFRGRTVVLEWNNPNCPFVQKHYTSGNMQGLQKQSDAPRSPTGTEHHTARRCGECKECERRRNPLLTEKYMRVSELSIEERVRKVLLAMDAVKRNVDSEEIGRETAIIGRGLGLDSVGVVELLVGVEKEFDIFIEASELGSEMIENVGALVNYVSAKLND